MAPQPQAEAPLSPGVALKNRIVYLGLAILGSLFFHSLLGFWLFQLALWKDPPVPQKIRVPIRLEFKAKTPDNAKSKKAKPKPQQETRQIIEAPMEPTEAPEQPAHLGAQNHRTAREQKTLPRRGTPGAPASALQNGALRLEQAPAAEGRIEMPTQKQKKPARYASLLPQKLDLVNDAHNDYIPDKNMTVGPVLDVNTTDYRFIGYFTAVRKLVDLAYYDIGPTLRDSPHTRERLAETSQVHFQGVSLVELKVMRSGVLVATRLAKSSGDKQIDEFWTRILNLAAPYPPLPRDYPGDELVFTYALYYDLVYQNEQRTTRLMF